MKKILRNDDKKGQKRKEVQDERKRKIEIIQENKTKNRKI